MALELYYHPLASFCWKVLIALYENATPFEPRFIDLGNATSRAELEKLWPMVKFPVLRDTTRDRVVPETSIIIEYLAQHYPGKVELLPAELDAARETRLRDRFYDLYVSEPMQKIVGDRLRSKGERDRVGVEQARGLLRTAYRMIEGEMKDKEWAMGNRFTMADCAAAPSLYYANLVEPFGETHRATSAYHVRLTARPSVARVIREAEPYFGSFPREP